MNIFAKLDAAILDRMQAAYDYLLDRFGVLRGSFRTGIILCGYSVILFDTIFRDRSPGVEAFVRAVVIVAVHSALIYLVFVRQHNVENRLQSSGKYDKLNAEALSVRAAARVRTVGYVLYFLMEYLMGGTYVGAFMLSAWTYSACVLVRDRDGDRFVKRKLASELG